ncbi:MAG: hypothetical protein H6740_21560 [Alphaproteobacteria bacterium]|nr:hypothetical protein [Alphaproteobacteria bacterium]
MISMSTMFLGLAIAAEPQLVLQDVAPGPVAAPLSGDLIVTLGAEVAIWERSTGRLLRSWAPPDYGHWGVDDIWVLRPGHDSVLVSTPGQVVELALPSLEEVQRLSVAEESVLTFDVSPDGRWLQATSFALEHQVWDLETGRRVDLFHEEPRPGRAFLIPNPHILSDPEGQPVVVLTQSDAPAVWRPGQGITALPELELRAWAPPGYHEAWVAERDARRPRCGVWRPEAGPPPLHRRAPCDPDEVKLYPGAVVLLPERGPASVRRTSDWAVVGTRHAREDAVVTLDSPERWWVVPDAARRRLLTNDPWHTWTPAQGWSVVELPQGALRAHAGPGGHLLVLDDGRLAWLDGDATSPGIWPHALLAAEDMQALGAESRGLQVPPQSYRVSSLERGVAVYEAAGPRTLIIDPEAPDARPLAAASERALWLRWTDEGLEIRTGLAEPMLWRLTPEPALARVPDPVYRCAQMLGLEERWLDLRGDATFSAQVVGPRPSTRRAHFLLPPEDQLFRVSDCAPLIEGRYQDPDHSELRDVSPDARSALRTAPDQDPVTGELVHRLCREALPTGTEASPCVSLSSARWPWDAALSPSGDAAFVVTEEGVLKLPFDADAAAPLDLEVSGPGARLRVSPDGAWLAVGLPSQTWLVDVEAWAVRRALAGPAPHDASDPLAFSPDGRLIARSSGGVTHLWSTESGALLATLILPSDGGWLVLAPDGRFERSGPEVQGAHYVVEEGGALRSLDLEEGPRAREVEGLLPLLLAPPIQPEDSP